ncbi:hypothetical protein N0V93_002023 [Gnomoniopsis smithogilvyi]|uniref:Monooxygenase n=1 Tax=Gnomoniopsis smithogilvyi TaxID=1191159 RepID=A0A9W8Z4N7_9PEZI|nr:hypothetical protein N0V93_002023 [Gnomoniopsis smithogilvyi]
MGSVTPRTSDYPPAVSLAKDVYRPFPPLPANLPPSSDLNAPALITKALQSLTEALTSKDLSQIKSCFHPTQAYWRDLLALTWHLRTFNDAPSIAPALLHLTQQRGWRGSFTVDSKSVKDVTVSPVLRWIDGTFSFETGSPAAKCAGRVVLLPIEGGEWKIWALSTWVESLESASEDEGRLRAPGRALDEDVVETEVFVLGGGNAGIILSARLKALGVDSVIVDRNPQPGDNWALRYDCLRFHIGRHSCATPFLDYDDSLPVILTRDDLASHMKKYAATFNLSILHSSTVEGSSFNTATRTWTIKVHTPSGTKVVRSKHLVQCTGIGGSKPFVPNLPGAEDYKGVNIHSAWYKNPKTLTDQGAKSVIVVGSANSAFDVMEDCAAGGLATTIVARSPTYLFPWDYALHPAGLGAYETHRAELVDAQQMTGPASIGGQLARGLHQVLAEKEPHRYDALAKAGFPVYDSREGRGDLMHHLLERGGGHFNDIGEGVAMIEDGRVKVKGGVEPVGYTARGLRFSDGSEVEADAVVWCTGFKDKEREVTAEVLGGKMFVESGEGGEGEKVVGPADVAARRDAVWGVDKEGEVRGAFKRHLKVDNYWIFGGTTAQHRFYSKIIALQIQAALDGVLPEAYREEPIA